MMMRVRIRVRIPGTNPGREAKLGQANSGTYDPEQSTVTMQYFGTIRHRQYYMCGIHTYGLTALEEERRRNFICQVK